MKVRKKFRMMFKVLFVSPALSFAADKWLQPSTEGMDTWFGSKYNTNAQFDNRDRVGGWGDRYYSLLRFNLSGLPMNPTKVVLWRYTFSEGGTPTAIDWYLMLRQWQTATVGYNNFPGATYVGRTTAPTLNAWQGVDITAIYNSWRAGLIGVTYANYGLVLVPASNTNNYSSFYSSRDTGGRRPQLQVTYTPQANDGVIKLKWPLSTAKSSSVVTQAFDVPWSTGKTCGGLVKIHNGVDYSTTKETPVYASEDGVVKSLINVTGSGYAWAIVLEHNHPISGKFTTVSWHVNALVKEGDFVPKGMQIATVANLNGDTHLHFGLRIGAYSTAVFNGINYAGTGSLPQTNCQDNPPNGAWYPAFSSSGFVSPENTSNVLFQ